jgi:hypothetical protein
MINLSELLIHRINPTFIKVLSGNLNWGWGGGGHSIRSVRCNKLEAWQIFLKF